MLLSLGFLFSFLTNGEEACLSALQQSLQEASDLETKTQAGAGGQLETSEAISKLRLYFICPNTGNFHEMFLMWWFSFSCDLLFLEGRELGVPCRIGKWKQWKAPYLNLFAFSVRFCNRKNTWVGLFVCFLIMVVLKMWTLRKRLITGTILKMFSPRSSVITILETQLLFCSSPYL